MRLLTMPAQIRAAAANWRKEYPPRQLVGVPPRWADEVYASLLALDLETATEEQVTAVVGDDRWIMRALCDECPGQIDAVVEIGMEPSFESATVYLCAACVGRLFHLCEEAPR